MRRLHLWIGLAGVVAFILTGQYMDRRLGHLAGMADLPRMLYRSAHIYLLLGSLLNLLLGLYVTDAPAGWRRWARRIGSVPIALAPLFFILAFAREPHFVGSIRPYAAPALQGVLFGAVLHAISHVGSRGTPEEAPYGTDDGTDI
jgi:hypothetical protein